MWWVEPLGRYRLFYLKVLKCQEIIHFIPIRHSFGFSDIFLEGISRIQRPPGSAPADVKDVKIIFNTYKQILLLVEVYRYQNIGSQYALFGNQYSYPGSVDHASISHYLYTYVTGFAKIVPNGTRIEIQIIA